MARDGKWRGQEEQHVQQGRNDCGMVAGIGQIRCQWDQDAVDGQGPEFFEAVREGDGFREIASCGLAEGPQAYSLPPTSPGVLRRIRSVLMQWDKGSSQGKLPDQFSEVLVVRNTGNFWVLGGPPRR